MKRATIFAYGSNMSRKQIEDRAPSVQIIGRAQLNNMRFVCNKKSVDGSAKANIVKSDNDVVWGVLFEIDEEDLAILDLKEGGYFRVSVRVTTVNGEAVLAETYLSKKITNDHRSYKWYKDKIVTGAMEHGLPEDYVQFLRELPTKD